MVVTKVWLSICGCALVARMPAVSERRRRRRVAAWRSIRVPRLLSRIGPEARVAIARSMASPTAGGRDEDDLGAFSADAQDPVTVLFAHVGDVGAGGLEDPQPQEPEHGQESEVTGMGGLPGGSEQ